MRRHTKAQKKVLVIAGTLASAFVLAACQQQAPKVTVQSGSFSTTITPSTYCFDATHCRAISGFQVPAVTADINGTVLVDVPREVANTGWAVEALTLSGSKALGGSGTIRGDHSYRVASNANSGNPFVVAVDQVRNGKPDGSRWSFVVRVLQN